MVKTAVFTFFCCIQRVYFFLFLPFGVYIFLVVILYILKGKECRLPASKKPEVHISLHDILIYAAGRKPALHLGSLHSYYPMKMRAFGPTSLNMSQVKAADNMNIITAITGTCTGMGRCMWPIRRNTGPTMK